MFSFYRLTAIFVFIFCLFFVIPNSNSAQVEPERNSSIYELKAGTVIELKMDNEISSKSSGAGDTFTAVVSDPVLVEDVVVLPIGAIVEGRIIRASSAAAGGKNGQLDVVFEKLIPDNGSERAIEAQLVDRLEARSSKTSRILAAIGGTAIGTLVGFATKTNNGALIGAGIGAGIGTGTAFLLKGKDVQIKADETFSIRLTKNVKLPARGY